MSSRGVSDTDATLELSLFLNGRSFVGREVARRVVSAAAERDGCSCAVFVLLLRHSCCVRFFSWAESTYVPSYLAPALSFVRSSRLEESATITSEQFYVPNDESVPSDLGIGPNPLLGMQFSTENRRSNHIFSSVGRSSLRNESALKQALKKQVKGRQMEKARHLHHHH